MKKWGYCLFSVVLSALVLGASADSAFALPKRLPKFKTRLPRVTTPNQTLPTRGFSTPNVLPNVAMPLERTAATRILQTPQLNAELATPAQVLQTPSLTTVPQAAQVLHTPSLPTPQTGPIVSTPTEILDTGTNLTGTQVLAQYFPTWRQELGGMFSQEQLDAVEKAFAATDEWIFVRGEDGELKARNKDEWDYEARFLTILQNSGVNFTERQIKQLVGSQTTRGYFTQCLLIEKITAFCITTGNAPKKVITQNGKHLKLSELRSQAMEGDKQTINLIQEVTLGLQLGHALKTWSKDSWKYERLYVLYERYGNKGTPARLKILKNIKRFILENGRVPRQTIEQETKQFRLNDLESKANAGDIEAAALAQELKLGIQLKQALAKWPKDSPEYKEIKELYDEYRNTDTPTQVIANIEQYIAKYNRTPRNGITRNGKSLSLVDLRIQADLGNIETTELAQELKLGSQLQQALRNWPQAFPKEYKKLQALYQQYRSIDTPAQMVSNIKQFILENNRTPRMGIGKGIGGYAYSMAELRSNAGKGDEKAAKLVWEQKLGRQLQHILASWSKTSEEFQEINSLYKQYRNVTPRKTSSELYTDLITHIKDYEHYPMDKESSLQQNIYNRLRYYRSTMIDGKYADPYLQKIYELKQWSERVKRGEVDWTQFPGLFKKHRRTIGEMREQGILPKKEVAQELEQLPAEEQEAIEQMADNMLTLWEDFEGVWWQQNHKHIITTPQTQLAFNTVLSTVRNQVPGANNVNISNVLEQLSSMQLGQDGPDYYHVIYRGNNPRLPRAEDFHNVWETQGIPQANAQTAYKLNSPHIELAGDEEMVYNMLVSQGVTDKEMAAVIDALTPAGWEIRLGAHELLSEIKQGKVHIHIEQIVPTTEEDAQDLSNVLRVDLRALTRGKNPQQVAKTLRYLFAKYLQEDGHQALNNIQKAF